MSAPRVEPDTARIADPTLTQDLAVFLRDLEAWTTGHAWLSCECGEATVHETRRLRLMQRKAELLARCRAQESL